MFDVKNAQQKKNQLKSAEWKAKIIRHTHIQSNNNNNNNIGVESEKSGLFDWRQKMT